MELRRGTAGDWRGPPDASIRALDFGDAAAEKRSMLFRPARFDELDRVAALVNGAYRGNTARRGWTHEADLLSGRRTDAAELRHRVGGGALVLVGTQAASDRPVAAVLLGPAANAARHVGMLTVDPDRQAAGIGRQLLLAAEAEAARTGARWTTISVISVRSELIDWYGRRGYRPTGRAPFPYDELEAGDALRDDLEFVTMEKDVSPGRAAPEA